MSGKNNAQKSAFYIFLGLIVVLVCLFFYKSFAPGQTLFSNDGPLGIVASEALEMPDAFFGIWQHLNWVGKPETNAAPNISWTLLWVLGPVLYSKFLVPISFIFLGVCAWICIRRLGMNPWVAGLVGLAAILNSDSFSNACWGLASLTLTISCVLLAIGAIGTAKTKTGWINYVLAGFAVGMAVMEGFDKGAILSLFVAAYVVWVSMQGEGKPGSRLLLGIGRTAVVAVCAAFLSAHTILTLISTQIEGVEGVSETTQTEQTSQEQWNWATQWSLPKAEALRLVVPGLFGYRMDTPDGGAYWGTVGQTPGWQQHHRGTPRFSGSGFYAGVFTVIIALWAAINSFGKTSVYSAGERNLIRFWICAFVIALLFAFGRHAPFYRLFYELPFFSTIRNPIKFIHPMTVSMLLLFGYGLEGLRRRYLETGNASEGLSNTLRNWWPTAKPQEKRWVLGLCVAIGFALLGLLVYASAGTELIRYLSSTGFSETAAREIHAFSLMEIGWSILFLALTAFWLVLVMSGYRPAGGKIWIFVFAGILITADLARANTPWIVYYNYKDKYASNEILDTLRQEPFKHRVAMLPLSGGQAGQLLSGVYQQWLQHHFQYYGIQSLDVIQMPRAPKEYNAFMGKLMSGSERLPRLWKLTNTRYLIGLKAHVDMLLNQRIDPLKKRFSTHTAFGVSGVRGSERLSVNVTEDGPLALIEFNDPLPRAAVYTDWRVVNDATALETLADPAFNPDNTVLVADANNLPTPPGVTNAESSVQITSYESKKITLTATNSAPSILLLNDNFDPDWNLTVDGEPAEALRCNYLMRGAFLDPGEHQISFEYAPPVRGFYVSVIAIVIALGLIGLTAFSSRRNPVNQQRKRKHAGG
ncbi:MAG: YfhO family protein [Verrucomicrobia bacterium]|nr:YfhO family protein [Verrucomicrobiota bacterium]